ncbi:hypothetical protein CAXC1_220071 [Candidatus Xenohaliotis californiensis]|uniref:Uncharacterized protein n=1 Tax=Candidatus Xenohaliotis californiensis TaxID=84677 RepID=A0ABP0ESH2_9RICK|nr:hypothetical protein CAXC1_220071 [Candidatus Xenohaliotis californiensis]
MPTCNIIPTLNINSVIIVTAGTVYKQMVGRFCVKNKMTTDTVIDNRNFSTLKFAEKTIKKMYNS